MAKFELVSINGKKMDSEYINGYVFEWTQVPSQTDLTLTFVAPRDFDVMSLFCDNATEFKRGAPVSVDVLIKQQDKTWRMSMPFEYRHQSSNSIDDRPEWIEHTITFIQCYNSRNGLSFDDIDENTKIYNYTARSIR